MPGFVRPGQKSPNQVHSQQNAPSASQQQRGMSHVQQHGGQQGNSNVIPAWSDETTYSGNGEPNNGADPSSSSSRKKGGKSIVGRFFDSVQAPFRSKRRESILNADDNIEAVREFILSRNLAMGDFALGSTVGTGTFGRVRVVKFKSHLKSSGKTAPKIKCPFALKIMKKTEIIALRQVEHIRCEKEILASIGHPFIVNLFGTFQDSKRLFMILEYVNGGEIFSLLRKKGRLHPEHGKFYVAEIALAFEYLHSLFIVYRDLKPENLLIDSQGHVKITDFGFAKRVEDLTWTLCGTPEYLAPEIIQSKGHNRGVDWWALGVLLFEFLSGYPPFYDEESAMGIYQKVIVGKFTPPKHMDVKAKDLIKRLLAVDRTKRLGCLAHGAGDVKDHKWFKNVNWYGLYSRQVEVPYIPEVAGFDDTSQFEEYPESTESSAKPIRDEEQENFSGF